MDTANTAAASAPPDWHPDPHVPGQLRWWSGAHWTEHTKPVSAPQAQPVQQTAHQFPVAGQPVQSQSAATPYRPADPRDSFNAQAVAPTATTAPEGESIVQQNPSTFFAIGISATYLVVALYTGIVFFGILPAYFGFKAFSNGEKLAPLGIIAAGIAIAFALTHRSTT